METENIYRKRKCNLCGSYSFEKYLGTEKVLDGGFTRIENWEKSGFGEMVAVFWEFDGLDRVDVPLCRACAEKLYKVIGDTMEELRKETQNGN